MGERANDDKARYEMLKKAGICTKCGHEDAEPNKTLCWECLDKEKISVRKIREAWTPEERERRREKEKIRKRELYKTRKEKNICTTCGKRKNIKWGLCLDCYTKRARKKHTGIARAERPAYGMCYNCGNPVMENKKLCKECVEKNLLSLARANEARKNKMHSWKQENRLLFSSDRQQKGVI